MPSVRQPGAAAAVRAVPARRAAPARQRGRRCPAVSRQAAVRVDAAREAENSRQGVRRRVGRVPRGHLAGVAGHGVPVRFQRRGRPTVVRLAGRVGRGREHENSGRSQSVHHRLRYTQVVRARPHFDNARVRAPDRAVPQSQGHHENEKIVGRRGRKSPSWEIRAYTPSTFIGCRNVVWPTDI